MKTRIVIELPDHIADAVVELSKKIDLRSPTMITLTLTQAEADQAAWALDPMRDHASDDLEEGRYSPAAVPSLDGKHLTFPSSDRAVPLDMLYRLEVQLVEMARDTGESYPRSARRLANKIRTAFVVTEDESRLVARGEV